MASSLLTNVAKVTDSQNKIDPENGQNFDSQRASRNSTSSRRRSSVQFNSGPGQDTREMIPSLAKRRASVGFGNFTANALANLNDGRSTKSENSSEEESNDDEEECVIDTGSSLDEENEEENDRNLSDDGDEDEEEDDEDDEDGDDNDDQLDLDDLPANSYDPDSHFEHSKHHGRKISRQSRTSRKYVNGGRKLSAMSNRISSLSTNNSRLSYGHKMMPSASRISKMSVREQMIYKRHASNLGVSGTNSIIKSVSNAVQNFVKPSYSVVSEETNTPRETAFSTGPRKSIWQDGVRRASQAVRRQTMAGGSKMENLIGSEHQVELQNTMMQKNRIIFHPYSNSKVTWDFLTLLVVLANIMYLPLEMTFFADNRWKPACADAICPIWGGKKLINDPTKTAYEQALWVELLRIFFDVWLFIDILITFNTGLVRDGIDGVIIFDKEEIKKAYLASDFWIDFLSTLPFDVVIESIQIIFVMTLYFIMGENALKVLAGEELVNNNSQFSNATQAWVGIIPTNFLGEEKECITITTEETGGNNCIDTGSSNIIPVVQASLKMLKVLKILKLVKIFKLARLVKFVKIIKNWEAIFKFQYDDVSMVLQIIKKFIMIFMILHMFACFNYWSASCFGHICQDKELMKQQTNMDEADFMKLVNKYNGYHINSWVVRKELHTPDTPVLSIYIWSVFMSLSQMLSIGYGQFPPSSFTEMIVVFVFLIVGAILWSVIIGLITNIISSSNLNSSAFKNKLSEIKEYMHFRKLPHQLKEDVVEYYNVRYQSNNFEEHKILPELNPILRTQVIDFNCYKLIMRMPLFKWCSSSFIHAIIYRLRFEVFKDQDVIIKEGQQNRACYFIDKGAVSIISKHFKLLQILSSGKFFGETCLLNPFGKRPATVSALQLTSVYVLATEDFEILMEDFPDDTLIFLENARKYLSIDG